MPVSISLAQALASWLPSVSPPYNLIPPSLIISSARYAAVAAFLAQLAHRLSWAAVAVTIQKREEGPTATVVTTTSTSKPVARKSLISRTLQRSKSGLSAGGGSGRASPPRCFSVYVGPERERFVVRAECANHPLFRRLLDDAEREYGYAAQGPLALPGCDVDAFLDVLWQMEHDEADDGGGGQQFDAAASSPICGLHSGSKGRAAGYRMLSTRSSPVVGRRR